MNSMIMSLAVMLVFAFIGWRLFCCVKSPQKWWAWMLVFLAVVTAGTIGVHTIVVGFPGFEMHLNDILQGLAIGAVTRFIIKTGKSRTLAEKGV
ncbi:MAG: hypothetical protein CVU42_01895 [Chloroflexi bacterium HGW-Chloroflexi-4]|jgi:hypothetical protein|nr:MAG: hypothetical protein CVU42_01895 [Chloroflexi bacterium HGW-Chloroflexi-4]